MPRAPSRTRYQSKPAQKWLRGRPRAPVRTRYQPKHARIGPFGHHCAERSRRKSCSPHTFPLETGAERSWRKIISTQVSASPGRAKKEPSHTFLTSHHPARPAPPRTTPPHHRPIPPHPTHTTPPHPTPHTTHHVLAHWPPMAILTGTHRHHDGDPSPS